MSDRERPFRVWLTLAGIGIATALGAAWAREKSGQRRRLAARERAHLVPLRQARTEADWTRQAVSYVGGAKGG